MTVPASGVPWYLHFFEGGLFPLLPPDGLPVVLGQLPPLEQEEFCVAGAGFCREPVTKMVEFPLARLTESP